MKQFPRRPDLLIRVLEHTELAALRENFSVTAMMPFLMHPGGSWLLVDEKLPLPPEDRLRVMADAVRASGLPSSLKADFEAALSDVSCRDSK
jgi:hypothetical protein